MQNYRQERKFLISDIQIPVIRSRIDHLLSPDTHAGQTGSYSVRSLYFDDDRNSCFYENENGTDPREKFRIRIYNGSTDRIMLECKRKERGRTLKTACPLTPEQAFALMRGVCLPHTEDTHPLLRKLTLQMRTRRLHPAVIVEYDRIPYVCPNGNVRITLDTNISSSGSIMQFLERDIPKRPVLTLGQQLLEVKYDTYLPDYIFQSLQLGDLRQTAFSKYYICRKFMR